MFADTRWAGHPRWFLSCPKDYFMRVPEEIIDCVVYVGRIIQKGTIAEPVLTGTAFLVSVPATIRKGHHTYLVTAQHVADPLSWGEWFIRFNTADGIRDVRPSRKEELQWWKHPTEPESVDAAAIPV